MDNSLRLDLCGRKGAVALAPPPAPTPVPSASRSHRWAIATDGHSAICDHCGTTRAVCLRVSASGRLVASITGDGRERCYVPRPRAPGVCVELAGGVRGWSYDASKQSEFAFVASAVSLFPTCGEAYHTGDTPRGLAVSRGWTTGAAWRRCEVSL